MSYYDQTLPEVVRRDDALPEVLQAAPTSGHLPPGRQYPQPGNNPKPTHGSAIAGQPPRSSRRILWISAIVCLLAVAALAIALGIVLSRRSSGDASAGANSSSTSTPESVHFPFSSLQPLLTAFKFRTSSAEPDRYLSGS